MNAGKDHLLTEKETKDSESSKTLRNAAHEREHTPDKDQNGSICRNRQLLDEQSRRIGPLMRVNIHLSFH